MFSFLLLPVEHRHSGCLLLITHMEISELMSVEDCGVSWLKFVLCFKEDFSIAFSLISCPLSPSSRPTSIVISYNIISDNNFLV